MKYTVRCLTFSALITIYAFAEGPGDSVRPIHGSGVFFNSLLLYDTFPDSQYRSRGDRI